MLHIIWYNLCVLHDCPFAISHTHLAFWITSAIKWQRGTAVSILNVHTSCVMLGLWLRGLSSRFSHVIGLDQSQNLLEKAVDYRDLGQLNWNTQEQLSFSSGPWSCFWCSKASWQCRLSSSPCTFYHCLFDNVYGCYWRGQKCYEQCAQLIFEIRQARQNQSELLHEKKNQAGRQCATSPKCFCFYSVSSFLTNP
jgi:hypothetical protein